MAVAHLARGMALGVGEVQTDLAVHAVVADGITVGAGVGQNAEIVMLQQPCCTLIPRHHGYRRADC